MIITNKENEQLYWFIKKQIDLCLNNDYKKESENIYKTYKEYFDSEDFNFSKPFHYEKNWNKIIEIYCEKINKNTFIFRFDFGIEEEDWIFDYYKEYYFDFTI